MPATGQQTSRQKATVTISARVTPAQKAIVQAAAVASGLSVSELIEREALRAARERLQSEMDQDREGSDGDHSRA